MTMTTLPWHPEMLRASIDSDTTVVADGIRLVMSSDMRVKAWITEMNLKEYYNSSLEVEVQVQRPVSSDYDPFVTGNISLVIAGRDKTSGSVKVCRALLAHIGSDKYPTFEEESRVREVALALIESDTLVARGWITMLNPQGIPLANEQESEQARTDAILALMDEARTLLRQRREDNLRKGTMVKVVRGRKVPIGTEGKVFWVGTTQFGKRIGFKDAKDVTHWTAWGNFEVTEPIEESAVIALAKELYKGRGYAKVFGSVRN